LDGSLWQIIYPFKQSKKPVYYKHQRIKTPSIRIFFPFAPIISSPSISLQAHLLQFFSPPVFKSPFTLIGTLEIRRER